MHEEKTLTLFAYGIFIKNWYDYSMRPTWKSREQVPTSAWKLFISQITRYKGLKSVSTKVFCHLMPSHRRHYT